MTFCNYSGRPPCRFTVVSIEACREMIAHGRALLREDAVGGNGAGR